MKLRNFLPCPKTEPNTAMHINNLSDNLLIEILQRLPCHLALQCKSVCKSWHSLISDPYFIRRFIHHHQGLNHPLPFTLVHQFGYWHQHVAETAYKKIHAISEHPFLQSRDFNLDFLPCFRQKDPWPIRIVASHKDLLVCCDNNSHSSDQSIYYICNVITKQWQATPPILGRHIENDTAVGFVTCDMDLLTAKYKLVRIIKLRRHTNGGKNHLKAEIYCSQTQQWSQLVLRCKEAPGIRRLWQFRTEAVTLNQTLHWMINGETIIAFDPFRDVNGQCRLIDLPTELNFEVSLCCLGTCREKLRVSIIKGVHPNRIIKVWELQDCGKNKWCLVHRICSKEMQFISSFQFDMLDFSSILVLAFHPNDGDTVYLRFHNRIVKCNMRKGTLEVVSKCLGDWICAVRTLTVLPFVHPCWPSLVQHQGC